MDAEQQRAVFDDHWPELRALLEAEGAEAVVRHIDTHPPEQRIALYTQARVGLVLGDWHGKNLDDYVTVADAGIRWLVGVAAASKPSDRPRFLSAANVISFNLAADLADCWPGDDVVRTREQLERGLRAGEDCVAWRSELDVDARSKQLGWWALGYHQLRLGDAEGALHSFDQAMRWAALDARERGEPDVPGAASTFAVNLSAGYRALAGCVLGRDAGPREYRSAVEAFDAQRDDPDREEDALLGLAQLSRVRGFLGV